MNTKTNNNSACAANGIMSTYEPNKKISALLKNVDAQLQEKVMLNLKFEDFLLRESDKPILDAETFTDYCTQYIQSTKTITKDQNSDAFPHEKTEEVGADETNTDTSAKSISSVPVPVATNAEETFRRLLDYFVQRKDLNQAFAEHIRKNNLKVIQALEKGTLTPDQCPFFYEEIEQYKLHEEQLKKRIKDVGAIKRKQGVFSTYDKELQGFFCRNK